MKKLSFGDDTTVMKAYHGTSLKNAESIMENGFRPSVGEKHWLGDGVYFFREDDAQAQVWAYHEKHNLIKKENIVKRKSIKVVYLSGRQFSREKSS